MKNYLAQTPQYLALTKILLKFRKTSTPLFSFLSFNIMESEIYMKKVNNMDVNYIPESPIWLTAEVKGT